MWEINGIRGRGQAPPGCAGRYSGSLVILGSAENVWTDLESFEREFKPVSSRVDTMALNYVVCHYPGSIDHVATLHPRKLHHWLSLRGGDRDGVVLTHAHKRRRDVACVWNLLSETICGTSALFAAKVALALGYQRVVLCGVPLDSRRCFYDPPGARYDYTRDEIPAYWSKFASEISNDRVKSMSGLSAATLGSPTVEWLKGGAAR